MSHEISIVNISSEPADNPYEAPAQPVNETSRKLSILDCVFVGFLSLIAATIAFVGTCGGMGFLGFSMSYPHGSVLGEFLMIAGWIVGVVVAILVGWLVGRSARRVFLKESKTRSGQE